MKVVCIDNKMKIPYDIRHPNNIFLTENKIYNIKSRFKISSGQDYMISVTDDLGQFRFYSEQRFISINEYRNLKIENILK